MKKFRQEHRALDGIADQILAIGDAAARAARPLVCEDRGIPKIASRWAGVRPIPSDQVFVLV